MDGEVLMTGIDRTALVEEGVLTKKWLKKHEEEIDFKIREEGLEPLLFRHNTQNLQYLRAGCRIPCGSKIV